MEQEAADELGGIESRDAASVVVPGALALSAVKEWLSLFSLADNQAYRWHPDLSPGSSGTSADAGQR